MERSLGNLSSAVRRKDAESSALQNAMHEQFAERNGLRAQLSGVDSQLVRLQGSYSELEARLRGSEEQCARLQAAQQRCASSATACTLDIALVPNFMHIANFRPENLNFELEALHPRLAGTQEWQPTHVYSCILRSSVRAVSCSLLALVPCISAFIHSAKFTPDSSYVRVIVAR